MAECGCPEDVGGAAHGHLSGTAGCSRRTTCDVIARGRCARKGQLSNALDVDRCLVKLVLGGRLLPFRQARLSSGRSQDHACCLHGSQD